jgi:hypothetical protein
MMIPVEAHLFLNHVPLVGLVFGLVFFVVGLMRASEPALWTGIRIFVAMGIAILPVAGSGLMSATILSGLTWLDLDALNDHRLAGILAAVVVGGLGIICAVVLFRAKGTGQSLSAQTRRAVLLLAVAGVGANLWAAYLGGSLRHSELTREESGLSRGR